MPRVPELRQVRTQERQLSTGGGFQTASFGGAEPIAAVGRAANNLATTGIKIFAVEKQKADKVRTREAEQELSKFQEDLLWNPRTGYYRKQGKEAMPASNEAIESFNNKTKELEEGLSNESQKRQFKEVSDRWGRNLNRGLLRHGFREAQKAEQALTEASIKNEKNNAVQNYGDVQSVGQSLAAVETRIQELAQSRGLPKEWEKNRVDTEKSEIHTRILQQMVNDGNYLGAKQYHGKVKDILVGQDKNFASKLVKNGSVRGESQRITDEIMLDSKFLSERESLEKARAVKDPEVRDAVVARVKSRFREKDAARKDQQESLYAEAENYLKAGKQIPADIWTGLDLKKQRTLAKYGNNVKNDDEKWLDFLDQNSGQLKALTKSDFQEKYWVHFNEGNRKKAETMWSKARNEDPDLTSTMNFNQRSMNSFISAGLGSRDKKRWGKKQRNDFIELQREAEQELTEMELNIGRKATGPEQQKIFDDLVTRKVFIKRSFRSDPEVPYFLIPEEERGQVYVDIDDIPEKDRATIENVLRSNQQYVTEEKIQDFYGAYITGNQERKNRILGK